MLTNALNGRHKQRSCVKTWRGAFKVAVYRCCNSIQNLLLMIIVQRADKRKTLKELSGLGRCIRPRRAKNDVLDLFKSCVAQRADMMLGIKSVVFGANIGWGQDNAFFG